VVGSGWRGGVSVEGGSGGVAASSGAVLWLEAEVREGVAGAASGRDEKHGAGGKNSTGGGWQRPFKGGCGRGGGAEESGDAWGGAGEREGGPGMTERGSGGRHQPPTGGHRRRRCRATAAGGKMRVARTRATDR
jgi:hypothetical protein